MVGIRGWGWEDFFSVSAWVFFTLIYAMVEFLGEHPTEKPQSITDPVSAVMGAPIAMNQEQREALPPEMRVTMREGAKAMFSSFFFLIMEVWSLKGCLVFLYLRLT